MTDKRSAVQTTVVTDEMVERAWAAIVGNDIAGMCFQVSIIRADLRTGLEAVIPAQAPFDRGRHYDIIAEALESYDEWMKDDDYNSTTALNKIMKRMRERLEMTDAPVDQGRPACGQGDEFGRKPTDEGYSVPSADREGK
jgi:hypothetical protein